MPVAFPAYPSTFATDILPDTGALYIGANGSNPPRLGITKGGLAFDPGRKITHVMPDGFRSPVKLLSRNTDFLAKISGKFVSAGTGNFTVLEPGISSAAGSGNVALIFAMQQASLFYQPGSYVTNVRLIFMRTDNSFFQVRFPAAICEKYKVTTKDKDIAELDVEFTAVLDTTVATDPFTGLAPNLNTPPYGFETMLSSITTL